jgi:hypothetical protein
LDLDFLDVWILDLELELDGFGFGFGFGVGFGWCWSLEFSLEFRVRSSEFGVWSSKFEV